MAYTRRFEEALVFAARVHRDQLRRGVEVPYVTHLLGVASLVGEVGGSEEQVIAALLHDAIEDCVGEIPDIRARIQERFGPSVLAIVEACSDSDRIPKPPWRERKERHLAALASRDPGDPSLLVSVADKLHNARTIIRDYRRLGEALWTRFGGGREGTLWYYSELARIFAQRQPGPLAHELGEVVGEILELAG